jgi:predicted ATPase/DNA-binding CsgD family transcriptional regulator
LEIRRLLAVTHTVTLTGPGGVGKTRLALHAGHDLRRYFRDGVWLVELAELDSPERLPQTLADALRVSERPGAAIEDALLGHLRERRVLLLLDACMGTLDACSELVSAIVSRCPDVRFVCTSRQRLAVPGETALLVSPLEVPAAAEQLPVSALADTDALRLLVDRARGVAPDFELTEENREPAVEICRRLDGLPLAIELAAGRLASIAPADLLERLDDRFRLLTAERGASGRGQALRATVEWSHELLSEEERILWRRLSVFAGNFGIEAAETVCSGDGLDRDRVLDLIASLVDKSILTMERTSGRGRYRLLETLRLFGAERLREAGEEQELQRRHAAWYYALVTRDDLPWWTVWEADLVDVLDAERSNLDVALSFYATYPGGAEQGLRLATDLWPYWLTRGSYRAGRRHIETFLAATDEPSSARSLAFFAAGFLAQAYDDEAAQMDFDEAYRLSGETGGRRERAYALLGLGLLMLRRGDRQGATDAFVASRETMLDVTGDPVGRSLGLYFLATALTVQQRLPEARRVAQEGLELIGESGNSLAHGVLNTLVGILDWLLEDHQSAERRLQEAVRLQDRLGHRWGLATSLDGLAWVAASTLRLERAALLLGAVECVWRDLGIVAVPYLRGYHDDCEADVRSGLGDTRFKASWERGLALRQRQVAALALEDVEPSAEQVPEDVGEEGFELTARELEVARLVADGFSNPAIAATLFVSRATVKTHVSHILRKLTLDSRVQLASWVAAHDPAATAPASR